MTRFRNDRRSPRTRRAMANLEVVLTMAVMLPISGAMLFLGAKMLTTAYQAIGALVTWPFL